jgi:hypothetical protein
MSGSLRNRHAIKGDLFYQIKRILASDKNLKRDGVTASEWVKGRLNEAGLSPHSCWVTAITAPTWGRRGFRGRMCRVVAVIDSSDADLPGRWHGVAGKVGNR